MPNSIEKGKILFAKLSKAYDFSVWLLGWLYHAAALLAFIFLYYLNQTTYALNQAPWKYLVTLWVMISTVCLSIYWLNKLFKNLMSRKYGKPGVLLKYNSEDCNRELWKTLPTYFTLKMRNRTNACGSPRCWCGSTEIKDWGLSSKSDHERVHICARCNYGVYRSER